MTGNKPIMPTTTATPARVRIFQATQRPIRINVRFDTIWGWCRVNGRLGQRHADLLESILYAAERRRTTDDGAVELLVDPALVRKTISDDRYSLQQIGVLIDDLRGAVLEIRTPRIHVLGGLLDHVVPTEMTRPNPLGGAPRHLWTVRLGLPLVKLLEADMALHYDPAPLCRLQYGISQAVARHVLTHRTAPHGGWKLDTLIHVVAGVVDGNALWKARTRVRSDAGGLSDAGIRIDGDRVFFLPHQPGDGIGNRKNQPHPPGNGIGNRKNQPHPPDSQPHPPGKIPKPATPARDLQDSSGIIQAGNQLRPDGGLVPCKSKTKPKTITPPRCGAAAPKGNACGATTLMGGAT